MITKMRDNIYLADKDVTIEQLKEAGVTIIEIVARDLEATFPIGEFEGELFVVGLYTDKINKPHVKDIACHIPKYMVQNGETVCVISQTGLRRAAFVICRAICELEGRTIFEVMQELKEKLPAFDLSVAYL